MRAVRIGAAGVLFGALVSLLFALAGPAGPASAHAFLLSSDPASGAVLDDAPDQVTLTFSEPVRLVPDRTVVVGPDGERVDGGDPRADGAELTIPLGGDAGARGTYLVSYRVISQDSHPIGGGLTYSVGEPSAEPPAVPENDDVTDPVVGAAMSVNKYVGYAGLVLLIGPALALALLWPHRLSRQGAGRLVWTGAGLVGLSTVAGVLLQAPYTSGESLFGAGGDALRDVLSSTYGTAHVVRLGVLVAVAVLLRPLLAAPSGQAGRADLMLLAGLGVVGLGTWPVAGHPVASPVPAVSVAVGTVHIAAAAVWIGGLVALFGFLLRRANERELGVILPAWSRWAATAVAVLMLAGLAQAVIEVGTPEALVSTGYGRLLLAKLGLFALVIAVAGYSRRLVRNRLGANRPGAMRVAVLAESLVLAAVLAVTSVLVQTTPGRIEVAEAGAEQLARSDFATTVESDLYTLQVIVEPAEQGINTVHLYAYSPEAGEPQPVEEWQATAALPEAGIEPIEVPYLEVSEGHITGQVQLPAAGDWEFRFTLRVSEIDQASVDVTVPIR